MAGIDLGTLSGTIDLASLGIDTNGDGAIGNPDYDLLGSGGSAAQLRAQFGDNLLFLDGSYTSNGRGVALIMVRSNVDNTVGVIALSQKDDGDYAGDFFAYLDYVNYYSGGGGQIAFDGSSGQVQSVGSIITYGQDDGLDGATVSFDPTGLLFKSFPQGGTTALNLTGIETQSSARRALDTLRNKIAELGAHRGLLGATESRFEAALQLVAQARTTRAAADSRIRDADIGSDAAELVRKQILQQVGASVLAQANQSPVLALTLLR